MQVVELVGLHLGRTLGDGVAQSRGSLGAVDELRVDDRTVLVGDPDVTDEMAGYLTYGSTDPFPRGCQPHNRFITKDADSKWRALRRRSDPEIDIPDSLPRTTRVGSLRKKGTVPFVHPEPERGLPYGVGPSGPCIKTGARWAGQAEGTSSLVSIYHTQRNKQSR